jgi:hypothetical protein
MTVAGFCDDRHVGLAIYQRAAAFSDQRLVVCDQDVNHPVAELSGRLAWTSYPPSGRGVKRACVELHPFTHAQ